MAKLKFKPLLSPYKASKAVIKALLSPLLGKPRTHQNKKSSPSFLKCKKSSPAISFFGGVFPICFLFWGVLVRADYKLGKKWDGYDGISGVRRMPCPSG